MDIVGLNLGMLNMTSWAGALFLQQTLNVNGPATLNGNVQMQGRHISADDLTIHGTVNTGGGSLTASGILELWGDLSGGGLVMVSVGILGYGGSIIGAFDIDMLSAGGVDFSTMSTVDLSGGLISMVGGSLLLPAGARVGDFSMGGGGSMSSGGGRVTVEDNLIVTSSGSLDIQLATIDVMGVVDVGPGATLYNDAGTNQVYWFNQGISLFSGTFRISAGGCELGFAAGVGVDVNGTGTFEIAGAGPPDRIKIYQDGVSGGTRWTLDYETLTTVDISWAEIQDGASLSPLVVSNCVDLGNNTGFIFERDIDVAPASLSFGAAPIYSTATDTLVVYNRGGETLSVTGITNILSQYSASPTVFTVAGYDSQYVVVDFTPDAPAFFIDSLTIASDDPDENPVIIPLSGNGAAADLSISIFTSPPELRTEGGEVSVSFTIENTGDLSSGPFRTTLRMSPDSVITTGDLLLDSLYVSDIAVGMDTTVNVTARLPKPAPRGDVYLGVMADDLDDVLELNEGNNTAWDVFTYQVPSIHNVRDIPSDQGGAVYMSWYRSPLDDVSQGGLITEYSLWRAIDGGAAAAMLKTGAVEFAAGADMPDKATPMIRIESAAQQTWFWQLVDTHPAYLLEAYGYDMPTLFDSTSAGFEYHYFQVMAHTSDRLVFYTAAPDSGYSVDNLAPAAPQNLAGEQSEPEELQLTWDPNSEPDLSHYAVYRGADSGFTPGPSNRLGETTNPEFTDGGWRWDSGFYYKITAIDVHDNESPYAWIGPDLVTGAEETGPPKANYLSQSRPNPFGDATRIEFGLAQDANVSIRIYDVAGRLVRTLVDERRTADNYAVEWNGRDDAGRVVAGGIYFYRIKAGAFVQTKKMTLLR
jgi:hypothetical protein